MKIRMMAWDDPMFEVFNAAEVIDGKEFVEQASFRSKMIRLGILGRSVLAWPCGVRRFVTDAMKN